MTRTRLFIVAFALLASSAAAQDSRPNPSWEIMRRHDADGDGKVSVGEYPRGEQVFRRLDRDRDGYLTPRDFGAAPAPAPAGAPGARPRRDRKDAAAPAPAPAQPEGSPPVAPTEEGLRFFETRIRPVLVSNCYGCHSADARDLKGGLRLDSQAGMLRGGETGPAVVPGDAGASLIIQALHYDAFEMPPKGKLSDAVIRDFEAWVKMGAPDPRAGEPTAGAGDAKSDLAAWKRSIDMNEARKFWSFQPMSHPSAPHPRGEEWAFGDLDRFTLAGMESHGLSPSRDADRVTWLRRVSFDLTGLPPTPEDVVAFERDTAPDAFDKVVDRLLASPQFGERWGRHWLDVARYAESSGKESNVLYPQAWRYRDWVIKAFNEDKPYDLFLKEQLAGDLMPSTSSTEKAERQIATGFLAIGSKGHRTRNLQQFTMDLVDEQIDATTQCMLGLTVACARCHDHKFDPIPTEDYYALAGVFLSTQTNYGTKRAQGNLHPSDLVDIPNDALVPAGPTMPAAQRAALERQRDRVKALASGEMPDRRVAREAAKDGAKPGDAKPDAQTTQLERLRLRIATEQLGVVESILDRFDDSGKPLEANRKAMGVVDARRPKNAKVLVRGEVDRPGDTVPRGFVQVISGDDTPKVTQGSGRLELAGWIASANNPLTARVMVNRIWLHLFGKGIVQTPDNFGKNGHPPTHPELLDWLGSTFVDDGWSVKKTIRRMVLSHTYRMSSEFDAKKSAIDPEDEWLWRMPKRRLEGECIRDAMLMASGTLSLEPPVGSPVGTLEGDARSLQVLALASNDRPVRSVYLPIIRDDIPEPLEVFDFAEPAFVTGAREMTNVATQALYMMNNAEVMRLADAFAGRLLAAISSDDGRIDRAFRTVFGRAPTGSELDSARTFLSRFPAPKVKDEPRRGRRAPSPQRPTADPHRPAWAAFCQALFASAEFRYVD